MTVDEPDASGQTRVDRALQAVADGRCVVILDDDGTGEGVLVCAADLATPESVAFMVRHSSGYLCVAMPESEADRLDLPPMQASQESPRTAYTVTVDAREGVGTGISARDRAWTIRLLASPTTRDADLSRPGHVVPIRARDGGVLRRPSHTEAAADLAALAGRARVAALCGVVGRADPTRMATAEELRQFASEHGLGLVTIADLVAHRIRTEQLVRPAAQARLPLSAGEFTAIGFDSEYDDRHHLALVMGDLGDGTDVLVRVHSECLPGEVFGSLRCDCAAQLNASIAAVAAEGRGVVLYMRAHSGRTSGLLRELRTYQLLDCGLESEDVDFVLGLPAHAKDYGTGAQILSALGVRSMRLLTNHPSRLTALAGYGLRVAAQVPIPIAPAPARPRSAAEELAYALAVMAG